MSKKKIKVVYSYGVFDLFHAGHVRLLKEAKELGEKLIVGVFNDQVAESFKRKPIIPLEERIEVVRGCKYVDEVIVQDELSPDKNIIHLKPDILARGPGAGWGDGSSPGEKIIKTIGGKSFHLEYHDGISTSQIIKKIKGLPL